MAERIVEEFDSPLEAEEARQVLLQAGCAARVQPRASGGVDQYLHLAGGWHELWVPEAEVEKARALVVAFRQELESDARQSENAAIEEAEVPAPPEPQPDRPRELDATARLGGRLLQLYALFEIASLLLIIYAHEGHAGDLAAPVLGVGPVLGFAAPIDLALGHWISQGGKNAARLALVRLWLLAVLMGLGGLTALPSPAPLVQLLPLFAVTASFTALLARSSRSAGLGLYVLFVALFVATASGALDRLARPGCPAPAGGIAQATFRGGDDLLMFCGDGRLTTVQAGRRTTWCWTVTGDGWLASSPPGSPEDKQHTRLGVSTETVIELGGAEYSRDRSVDPCR